MASVLAVGGPTLLACARAAVTREVLTGWESRYVAAPECRPALSRGTVRASDDARHSATLVVRLATFGASAPVAQGSVALSPLDAAPGPAARVDQADERPPTFVARLAPGRYALASRGFGFVARTDTVVARAGATDSVTITLEEYEDALRNRHNCRPRGFRRLGERACVTDQITAVLVLDRARDMASPRFRFGIGLPAGDSSDVRIVDDERICERAARVYGLGTGPPRRVVVVDAVNFYVVYDPAEPVTLGEFNQWLVLDRRLRVLARMAL
ncbi:MAG TPA: hypothetical protein VFS59_04825 [Gemmatimonadaceae bacterium]|nr:hypothetical protein [Gemmatimonadaceae bacterium]